MQLPPNPELAGWEPLVGDWRVESPILPGPPGRTSIGWHTGGAFLVVRSTAPDPIPDGIWVIGSDGPGETCTALYYDSRGVSRVYSTSLADGLWRIWRQAPGFSQRFTGRLGGDVITAAWELSEDGSTWKHDFDLVYTRLG